MKELVLKPPMDKHVVEEVKRAFCQVDPFRDLTNMVPSKEAPRFVVSLHLQGWRLVDNEKKVLTRKEAIILMEKVLENTTVDNAKRPIIELNQNVSNVANKKKRKRVVKKRVMDEDEELIPVEGNEKMESNSAYVKATRTGFTEQKLFVRRENVFVVDDRARVYHHNTIAEETNKLSIEQKLGLKMGGTQNYWLPERRAEREKDNGHEAFGKSEEKVNNVLDPTTWHEDTRASFWKEVERGKAGKEKAMKEFKALEGLEEILKKLGIVSLRSRWLEALTAVCLKKRRGKKYKGCGKCAGCWNRFAQACMLVKSASGVSDELVVMHWGAVFRSKRYRDFFFKHWAEMDRVEYSIVANSCSCACMNACYIHSMLGKVLEDGELPLEVEPLMRFYGFGLKSASLILNAVLGENCGIAVDVHLARIMKKLGWCVWATKDETKMSLCVAKWLDRQYWGKVNDLLAGLSQLLVLKDENLNYKHRQVIMEEAVRMDRRKKGTTVEVLPLVQALIHCLPTKK
jgi:endonuclease III